jgi:Ca2+-transporting ATPase
MQQLPRQLEILFILKEMSISIIQGIVITLGILFVYQFTVQNGGTEIETRTMVFTTLVFSNLILSLVNRSFTIPFLPLKKTNNMMVFMNIITVGSLAMILYITLLPIFQSGTFKFFAIIICTAVSVVAVLWIEIYKWNKRRKTTH